MDKSRAGNGFLRMFVVLLSARLVGGAFILRLVLFLGCRYGLHKPEQKFLAIVRQCIKRFRQLLPDLALFFAHAVHLLFVRIACFVGYVTIIRRNNIYVNPCFVVFVTFLY